MNTSAQTNLCRAFLYAASPGGKRRCSHGPVVTISREAGARGNSIAKALVAELTASEMIAKNRPWTVFNQDLLQYVIQEHHLPERTADYFPEDQPEEVRSLIGELLGLHPGVTTSARKVAETLRRLAEAGNAIIVGRGANLVTANMTHAIHVRLIGDVQIRVRHFAKLHHLTLDAAHDEVVKRDLARKRYIRKNFGRDIEDARQYDLILNTDRFENAAVGRIIRAALEEKFR